MSDSYINLTILTNDIRLESNKLSNILHLFSFKTPIKDLINLY